MHGQTVCLDLGNAIQHVPLISPKLFEINTKSMALVCELIATDKVTAWVSMIAACAHVAASVSAASNALEQTVLAKGIHAKALVLDAHADIEIPGKESRYVGDDGLSKVSPEKMQVGGVDASQDALLVMAAGDYDVTVFQDSVGQGTGSIDAALRLIAGEAVDQKVYIPFKLVTPANMGDFLAKN